MLWVVMVFMMVRTSNLIAVMKKFMKSLVLFAAAAMALTSCENEMMNEGIESNETYTLTFTADAPESRTSVSIEGETASFKWSEGDKIGFYYVASDVDYEKKSNSNAATIDENGIATFTGKFTPTEGATDYHIAAFYPGNSWVSHADENPFNNVKVKIPSAQTLTEGTFDPAADLMMSKPLMNQTFTVEQDKTYDEQARNLEFGRLAAIGRMNLKGLTAGETITSVKVEFTDFNMAGEVTLDMENQTFEFGTANTTNAITLTGTLTAAAETPVFFTCFPNNYNGDYVVTVTTESATATTIYTKEGTISKAIEFTSGNVMGFNVNLATADKQVVGKLIELDSTKRYLFKEATEMKDGWYAIVANGVAATAYTASDYGRMSSTATIAVGEQISLPVMNAFGFMSTTGGYTIQQYDMDYLQSTTDYATFNFVEGLPASGHIWSVAIADGVATITNNDTEKSISYSSSYNNFEANATISTTPTLYELVEIDNGSYLLGVSTNELTMIGAGGEISFNVTTYGEGTLTATANNDWLETSVDAATGTVTVTVKANTGDVREGTITVAFAGQELTVTVSQDAPIAAGTEVEATLTFDNTSKRTEFVNGSKQVWVENGITLTNTGSCADYADPVRLYKNTQVEISAPGNISKIVFNSPSGTASKYLLTLSDGTGYTVSGSATTTVTITLTTPSKTFSFTNSVQQARLSSIVVTYTTGDSTEEPDVKEERNLAWSAATATATVGEAFTAPTLSGVTDGVTYTSSNTGVATIDASGVVTIVAAGTTTITATAEENETHNAGEASYTLTVSEASTGGDKTYYVKVTEAPTDWSGTYLIVYQDENMIFDGSLTTLDAANNYKTVTIADGKIEATAEVAQYQFTIATMTGGYSIQAASGMFIGHGANANKLTSSDVALKNTITFQSADQIDIVCSGGAYLRFNTTSGQDRFRYYKSDSYTNQKAIQLYKLEN